VGCGQRDLDKVSLSEEKPAHASDIAMRPKDFYGRPVTVVAEVESVHGPGAFTLDEDAALAGPDVLVIVPKGTQPVEENREVTVHGTVRPLVIAELERDYAWFDPSTYEPDLLVRFKERPVIIADSVRDDKGGDVLARATRPPAPVD
jgi:hypothetical protein